MPKFQVLSSIDPKAAILRRVKRHDLEADHHAIPPQSLIVRKRLPPQTFEGLGTWIENLEIIREELRVGE
jgi:hypothetical protein